MGAPRPDCLLPICAPFLISSVALHKWLDHSAPGFPINLLHWVVLRLSRLEPVKSLEWWQDLIFFQWSYLLSLLLSDSIYMQPRHCKLDTSITELITCPSSRFHSWMPFSMNSVSLWTSLSKLEEIRNSTCTSPTSTWQAPNPPLQKVVCMHS